MTAEQLLAWVDDRAAKSALSAVDLCRKQPKELFEYVMRERLRRTVSPRDFEEIGKRASIRALESCDSFNAILQTLRTWFP